jgi:adenylosuccinate lyase
MAHIMEFGDHCPTAKNIIHLGATSCYVTDNTDIILMQEGISYLSDSVMALIKQLAVRATSTSNYPITGRTHLQRAQLTTIGKRICMWLNDVDIAYDMLTYACYNIRLLGCKGATGSQASFKTLFDGNYKKACYIDDHLGNICDIGVARIAGQTYTRLYDSIVANALSITAQALCKMATDIRLMACFGEMYEQFDKNQIGSSAMPYKRNPINCEKVCGLSRHVICNAQNMAFTASTQWLERTLDDSSNRRITIPELFITLDEALRTMLKVVTNMTINVDACRITAEEHSKMASLEDDIIKKVLNGGNRQDEHANMVYSDGSDDAHMNTGFANEQVQDFCNYIDHKHRWRYNG